MSAWSDALLAHNPNSFWPFGGASPLADAGSAGITLTAVGSPVRVPSLVPGEAGAVDSAYQLDGSTAYFTAGDNYDFDNVDFSIGIWVKPQSANFGSGFQRLFNKRETSSPLTGWTCYGSTGGAIHWEWDEGANNDLSGAAGVGLAENQTRFIVMTWTDSTNAMAFYSDGAHIGTDSAWSGITPWATATTALFAIGATSGGGNKLQGTVDDPFVIVGTVLSAAEVLSLWDAANELPEKETTYFKRQVRVSR